MGRPPFHRNFPHLPREKRRIAAERELDANQARPCKPFPTQFRQIQNTDKLHFSSPLAATGTHLLVVPSNADRVRWVPSTGRGFGHSKTWNSHPSSRLSVGFRTPRLAGYLLVYFGWIQTDHMGHRGIPDRAIDGCYRYSCPQPTERGGRIGSRLRSDRRFRFPGGGSHLGR